MICGLVRGFKRLLRGMYCKDQVEYSLSIMAGAPVIFAKKKKKRKELSNDTRESVSSSVEVEVEKTKEKKRLRRKRVEQAGAI